jgi:HNH endonuclease
MGSAKSVSAFSPSVRKVIIARTGGRCDRCGFKVSMGHFHHRKPRRMGGSVDPSLGKPSNGLLLHPKCHEFIESHRKASAMMGYLLNSVADPSKVPVYTWRGWMLLGNDGSANATERPPLSALEIDSVDTDAVGDTDCAVES